MQQTKFQYFKMYVTFMILLLSESVCYKPLKYGKFKNAYTMSTIKYMEANQTCTKQEI